MIKSLVKKSRFYPVIHRFYSRTMWWTYILSDLAHTYVFKSKIEAATPFGFNLVSRNYVANRMMLKGAFEQGELDIFTRCLRTADVFIDIGANIGYYTCIARSLSKGAVAVEPQPQNLECLYENLRCNGWSDTEVYPLGLSDKPGLLTLYGASGPSASLVRGWAGYSDRFKRTIPVTRMDHVIGGRFEGKKLFIKIDVEGAEYNVLKGADKVLTLSPRPTWFVEICLNQYHPGALNPNYADTFDLFWQHDYEVRLANPEYRMITPADIRKWIADGQTDTNEVNYLFVPKGLND